jgi:hypothetical protein
MADVYTSEAVHIFNWLVDLNEILYEGGYFEGYVGATFETIGGFGWTLCCGCGIEGNLDH